MKRIDIILREMRREAIQCKRYNAIKNCLKPIASILTFWALAVASVFFSLLIADRGGISQYMFNVFIFIAVVFNIVVTHLQNIDGD